MAKRDYYKIGSKWGNDGGNYYDVMKSNRVVIYKNDSKLNINDIGAISKTGGHEITDIGIIKNKSQKLSTNEKLQLEFSRADAGISDYDPYFYDVEWINIKNNPIVYQLQQGWCKINQEDVKKEIESRIKKYNQNKMENKINDLLESSKNLILTGAPGVGKTYKTAEIAVAIADGTGNVPSNRKDLMSRYKELINSGQIAFTTFHQSLDYEEFVEGLKPDIGEETKQGLGTYSVRDGIFKQICTNANRPISISDTKINIRPDATIWKVSLKGAGDNDIRKYCLENNMIRIGWDDYGENIDGTNFTDGGKNILSAFIDTMQIGDVVLSLFSNTTIDAIGIIDSDYYYDKELKEYKRCRNVKWLWKADKEKEDIYTLNNNKTMTMATVYKLWNFTIDKVISVLKKHNNNVEVKENTRQYVLIIDEINRGNISKIFGELITLLEKDKRKGKDENGEEIISTIEIVLPYSQEKFTVPSNLYIIGTMNTADRSIGAIDYALRRRFAFVSLKADKTVISNYAEYQDGTKAKAENLFDNIKTFIDNNINEDLNADDLMVGHSYFLCKTEDDLKRRLEYEIKPLLEEYQKDGILICDRNILKDKITEWQSL